ncbi:MAG TPA: hypothetical protein VGQ65_18860 [Thermoanaerobaculia bacterium]|jgi:hypothetical protein|nr:hypothetical protein [Thermoanaerobaculia bacterium]
MSLDGEGGKNRRTQIVVALIAAAAGLGGYFLRPPHLNVSGWFQGRVVDEATRDHLAGAKVALEAGGVPPILYSDSEGVFAFPVPEGVRTARVRIELAGYERYDRQVDLASINTLQEIRIRPVKSSGDVPVPVKPPTATVRPTTEQSGGWREPQQAEGFTFTLQNCSRRGSSISCEFSVVADHKDQRLLVWGKSRVMDARGKAELASSISLAGTSTKVGQYSSWSADLVRGIRVAGGIVFDGIDQDQKTMPLIELVTSAGNVQFRDVPLS